MVKQLLLSAALSCALNTQTMAADNLVDILTLAMDNDPVFQAAKAQKEATAERYYQTRSALLPQVSLTGSYTRTDGESQNEGQSAVDSETDDQSITIGLEQLIYDHGTWIALSQSEKTSRQAAISLEADRQSLIIRAASAYLDVLSAEDNVEFSKAETEAIGQQLEQTKQRYQVGLIARTDVHEAQADYDRALSNQIIAQNNLDIAHEVLREITGRYHSDISSLTDRLELVSPQPANIDQWVKVAEENNIAYNAQKLGVEIAREEIKRRRSGHYPNASFSLGYNDRTRDVPTNELDGSTLQTIEQKSNGVSAGIEFSWPLYRGGRTISETKEARHLFSQATSELERTHREAQRSTRSSYLGVSAGISSVKALQQSVVSNESALEATQAGFEVGTRTIVDVLLSTRSLFQAKSELSRAKYDYILNLLTLKQSAGILTKEDIVKINSWLEK
ncbi:MAG: TolC family outer membrane protein [Pseudomonadota bacterium]